MFSEALEHDVDDNVDNVDDDDGDGDGDDDGGALMISS